MTRKRKRRSAIVEIGNGPAKVRIYTINRKDGYDQFTLAWKEGGRRRTRCFSCMDEAKMVGQQVSVRLINGGTEACEATRRDIKQCEHLGCAVFLDFRRRRSGRACRYPPEDHL